MELIFEWNEAKAKSNLQKHKISFDEALTIFDDSRSVTYLDDFYRSAEERFISVGTSMHNRILLVVYTEQDKSAGATIIRIISCRKATALEREIYEQG